MHTLLHQLMPNLYAFAQSSDVLEFLVPYVQVRLRPSDGRAPAYCDSAAWEGAALVPVAAGLVAIEPAAAGLNDGTDCAAEPVASESCC